MATKKKAKKKTTKKKPGAKTTKSVAIKATKTPHTKSVLYAEIADRTDLTKKQISGVFEELASIVNSHITRNAVGIFTLPGMLKIKVVRKPATKARKGINPFTGEPTIFKAKPARNVVKIQALKALKEMVK